MSFLAEKNWAEKCKLAEKYFNEISMIGHRFLENMWISNIKWNVKVLQLILE
jgi:hypothetical protein